MAAYEVIIDSRNQTDPGIKAAIANFQNLDKYLKAIANRTSSQTSHMTRKFNELIAATKAVEQSVVKMGKSMKTASTETKKVETQVTGVVGTFDALGYAAYRVGAVFDQYLGRQIREFGADAMEVARNFSRSMGEIQTIMRGNLAETTARAGVYKEDLIEISNDMGIAFEDMAGGFYESISAFGEGEDAMEQFGIAAQVAKAGLASTTEAVDLLSSVSLAFGDTSVEMLQHIADLSFKTVQLTKTHIPELADSIAKVAPYASDLGVGLEEMYAASATLIGVTGNTAETMTQLRRVMISMQKPAGAMEEILRNLGYVGANAGRMIISERGVVGAIQAIRVEADRSGIPIEKAIGRVQGIMGALALSGDQAERFVDMLGEMGDVSGATEDAFNDLTQGINETGFALDQAETRLENAKAAIGESLLGIRVRLTELAAALVESYAVMPDWIQGMTLIGGAVVSAIGPLTQMLASMSILAKNLPSLAGAFTKVGTKLGGILKVAGPVGAVLGTVATAIGLLIRHRRGVLFEGAEEQLKDVSGAAAVAGEELYYLQDQLQLFSSGRDYSDLSGLEDLRSVLMEMDEQSTASYGTIIDIGLQTDFISDSMRTQLEMLKQQNDAYDDRIDLVDENILAIAQYEEAIAASSTNLQAFLAAEKARLEAERRAAAAAAEEDAARKAEIDNKILTRTQQLIDEYNASLRGVGVRVENAMISDSNAVIERLKLAQELYEGIRDQPVYGRAPWDMIGSGLGDTAMRDAVNDFLKFLEGINDVDDKNIGSVVSLIDEMIGNLSTTDFERFKTVIGEDLMESFLSLRDSLRLAERGFSNGIAPAMSETDKIMKELMSTTSKLSQKELLASFVGENVDTTQERIAALNKAYVAFATIGTPKALEMMKLIEDQLRSMSESADDASDSIDGILEGYEKSRWQELIEDIEKLEAAMEGAADGAAKLKVSMQHLMKELTFVLEFMNGAIDMASGAMGAINGFMNEGSGVNGLGDVIMGAGGITMLFSKVVGSVMLAVGAALKKVGQMIRDFQGWSLAEESLAVGEGVADAMMNGLMNGLDSTSMDEAIKNLVREMVISYYIEANNVIPKIQRMIKKAWRRGRNDAGDKVITSDEIDEIITAATGSYNEINAILAEAGLDVTASVDDTGDSIADSFLDIGNKIAFNGGRVEDMVTQAFDSINGAIIGAVSSGSGVEEAILNFVRDQVITSFLITPEMEAEIRQSVGRLFGRTYDYMSRDDFFADYGSYDINAVRSQSWADAVEAGNYFKNLPDVHIDDNRLRGMYDQYMAASESARQDVLSRMTEADAAMWVQFFNSYSAYIDLMDARILEDAGDEFFAGIDGIISGVEERTGVLSEIFPELFPDGDITGSVGDTNITAGETTVTRAPDQYFTINNYGVFVDRDEWIEDMKEEFAQQNEVVVIQR